MLTSSSLSLLVHSHPRIPDRCPPNLGKLKIREIEFERRKIEHEKRIKQIESEIARLEQANSRFEHFEREHLSDHPSPVGLTT